MTDVRSLDLNIEVHTAIKQQRFPVQTAAIYAKRTLGDLAALTRSDRRDFKGVPEEVKTSMVRGNAEKLYGLLS
jgi:hypothetical protein